MAEKIESDSGHVSHDEKHSPEFVDDTVEGQRRESVALNIVENPLKVRYCQANAAAEVLIWGELLLIHNGSEALQTKLHKMLACSPKRMACPSMQSFLGVQLV